MREFIYNNLVVIVWISALFVLGFLIGDFKPFLASLLGIGIGAIFLLLVKLYAENKK